jgi:hypothetical protein
VVAQRRRQKEITEAEAVKAVEFRPSLYKSLQVCQACVTRVIICQW